LKTVILAGGLGTRISEESHLKPKPMVEIGNRPILWHIMKLYSHYGHNDFIICCGYRGYAIKEYFNNYRMHHSDITFDFEKNIQTIHATFAEKWRVTVVDTGENTMTGGRLKRILPYLNKGEDFCFTYGDGLSDVDINSVIKFHQSSNATVTVTATQPPGRWGVLNLEGNLVTSFTEKPQGDGGLINGGFFVAKPSALEYIDGDSTVWEQKPMEKLAKENKLAAYVHKGFWQPMDTLRDKNYLESIWQQGKAPWKKW
jgi:glucose-1-phosphate cytidylyltransferase